MTVHNYIAPFIAPQYRMAEAGPEQIFERQPKPRKVVLTVDGSKHSARVFDWFFENVYIDQDELLVVHAIELPHMPVPYGQGVIGEWTKELHSLEKHGKELLSNFGSKCKNFKHRLILEGGKAGETVCKVAKEKNANLIVIGSRGKNLICRTLMGSHSDYVLHHAHIPVLIVPPEHHHHH